jgi:hypothetical protein
MVKESEKDKSKIIFYIFLYSQKDLLQCDSDSNEHEAKRSKVDSTVFITLVKLKA